jgi:decaprenylphospho-beta-D-ribofuranose 2-oxidase
MAGYTLALDLPFYPGLPDFLRGLDAVLLEHGGRVYLAKDAVTTAASYARMYPELARFQAIAATHDPDGRLKSSQARRLALRG